VCHSQAIHEFLPSRDPATGEIIPGQYLVIQCDLNALNTNSSYVPKFRYIFQAARQMSECKVVLSREDMQDIDVEPLFWACIRERHTRDYGFTVLLNGFISDLLIQIIRVWRRNGLDPQNLPFGKPEDKELSMIAEYIDAHSNQAIRVQDLAEMCNMSYSYFAKNFRDYYGMSCKEYIEYVRMNKAEELVLFTDYDLNYICQEIGYFDCSHFIKEYKKHKGVTPKQHRMRMRKQKGEEVLNYFDENDLIQKNEE
jgi:AraC-like DNA-binding protein